MGILDIVATTAPRSTAARTAGRAPDAPAAQVYLNAGYQAGERFVNIPLGIAVDTMLPVKVRGTDPDWNDFQNAQNDLIAALQAAGVNLGDGEEVSINLELRLRRVNAPVAKTPATENKYGLANAASLVG